MSERQTSVRLMIQMVANIFICKYAQKDISKSILKTNKPTRKAYCIFLLFAIILFAVNQGLYIFFKNKNLYEIINISRKTTLIEIKQYGKQLRVMIMQEPISIDLRMKKIKEFEQIVNILSHPARRLTYDSFGHTEAEYAWSFKSQSFLVQTIISSSFFYIICTFMNMMNRKKGQLQEAFKLEIMVMIILLLWEIDLILSTESKLHHFSTDILDEFYLAFPIFERREFIRVILIPSTYLVEIFIRFYIISDSEKKLMKISTNSHLRALTAKVGEHVSSVQINENLEHRVGVALSEMKNKQPLNTDIFLLQREVTKRVIHLEEGEILPRQSVNKALRYLMIN